MEDDKLMTDRITHVIDKYAGNQAALAVALNVSKSTITQWKNGDTKNIKMAHLYALADITGFNARWIAIGDGPKTKRETAKEVLDISSLSDDSKTAIKETVSALKKRKSPKAI